MVRKTTRQDNNETAMDKAKGRIKEAGAELAVDNDTNAKGRADQRSGTATDETGTLKDLLK